MPSVDGDAIDVVYLTRREVRQDALRLSLRSIDEHLPHARVWLAGYAPRWIVDVSHLATRESASNKYARLNEALLEVAQCDEISERFVYMNDDVFVLEPVDEIPALHRGPIASIARTRITYRESLRLARAELESRGVESPLSYELHVPMLMERAKLRETFELARVPPGMVRTMYGNVHAIGGDESDDVKVYGRSQGLPPGPFASTSPASIHPTARAGRELRATFARPSRYERKAA